jgi:hypothetical protein
MAWFVKLDLLAAMNRADWIVRVSGIMVFIADAQEGREMLGAEVRPR